MTAVILRDQPGRALDAIQRAIAGYQQLTEVDADAVQEKLASAQRIHDEIAARIMFDDAVEHSRAGRDHDALALYDEMDARFREMHHRLFAVFLRRHFSTKL